MCFKLDVKTYVFDINQSMLDEGAIKAKKMGLNESCNI